MDILVIFTEFLKIFRIFAGFFLEIIKYSHNIAKTFAKNPQKQNIYI